MSYDSREGPRWWVAVFGCVDGECEGLEPVVVGSFGMVEEEFAGFGQFISFEVEFGE